MPVQNTGSPFLCRQSLLGFDENYAVIFHLRGSPTTLHRLVLRHRPSHTALCSRTLALAALARMCHRDHLASVPSGVHSRIHLHRQAAHLPIHFFDRRLRAHNPRPFHLASEVLSSNNENKPQGFPLVHRSLSVLGHEHHPSRPTLAILVRSTADNRLGHRVPPLAGTDRL